MIDMDYIKLDVKLSKYIVILNKSNKMKIKTPREIASLGVLKLRWSNINWIILHHPSNFPVHLELNVKHQSFVQNNNKMICNQPQYK